MMAAQKMGPEKGDRIERTLNRIYSRSAMKKIEIKPSWVFSDESGAEVDHRLFALLHGVRET